MAGTPADGAAMEDDEEPPVISPREGLQERLRKARERRKRRASGDVLPGGEGKRHHRPAATAMPETPMAGPLPAYAMQGSPAGQEDQGGGMPTQEVEAVKASSTSLAQKRALLQQQRKQRKLDADRMLARRQSGQMGPSSKLEPGMSPAAADQQGEQPRLFDEFNDDDDDDYDGGYGYGAVEGKGSGVKVVLVAPNSSPAMPSAAKKSSGCCGGGPVPKRETRSEADAKRATTEGGDAIPPTHPHPVLASGWAGGDGARAYWNIPGGSLEARREEEARKDASAAEAGKEEGEEALLGKGRTDGSGTERVRRVWVAARDGDERRRLLKEEEGLAVGQLPKSAPGLMRRGAVQDRLLRDAVFARAEEDERAVWRDLQGGTTEGDVTDGLDCESMYGDGQAHRPHRAPSATVFPSGRGPSQASDFFSARGAPSILEDPLEPLPMRVERPPADEIPPPPAYLEAYVRRPTAGIGPEARLAGLDERTELRIVVPRVAFHDHPLFANEDRLGASLRKLFGRYRAKLAADEELYLRRRLSASLSALLSLRAQIDGAQETSSAAGSAVVAFKMGKRTRERANWLLRDSLTTLASVLAEKDEVLRLERTMNATWSDLEEDRRERGISSTGTRLTERKVEKRDGNEIRATAAGWGNNDEIDEEDDDFFSSRGEGGRKLDGSSLAPLDQQLSQLESFLGWLSAQDSLQSLARSGEAAATGGGNTSEVSEGRTKKHNRAEERRRRDTRKKLELVIAQCRTSLGGRSGGTDEGSHVLRLSNDGIVTPDVGCGRLERARREEARELRFRLAVFVNGSKVSTTRAVPFEWPEFACSFNHLVRLRLVRRPESVMVAIYSCSGVPWWPDQEVASVWVPVPGGQDNRFGDSMGAGPQTTHAFAPRTQWTQFSSRRPMATSGPLADRRTCGSVLVGTDWSTSRDGTEDTTSGGVFSEGDNASAPTLPVRGGADSYSHLTLREIFNALWTAEGRSKLRAKPLQGLRSSQLGTPGGRGEAGGSKGGGGGASGAEDGDASRTIPDFAREADFLHLLPCGADIDPNDPRHGNLMRMRGLLSTLDLDRRESSVVARGPRAGSGLGPTRRPASARGGASAGAGNEGVEDGGEEEDTDVFRASQEQQALVFAGKRIASGLTGGAGRADVGGGRGGFRTFAFNNHRRWKEPLRHTLIRLRVQKPTLFGNRPIPLREDDIRRDETLTAILAQEAVVRAHRHEASGRRGSLIFDGEADVELDTDKQKKRMAVDHGRVMDFVQRVRDSRTAQARRQALKRVTYSSVVQEGAVPQLGINFEGGSFFPKPKRALRPEPKERAAATIQLDECRLLLQIVSARNVPVRSEEGAGGLPASTAMAIPKQQQPGMRTDSGGPLSDDEDFEEEKVIRQKGTLSSFVEVQFQDYRKRTNVYEGLTPLWKESLDLPFTPPMADFSPANLAQVHEMIIISLFDEVEFDDRSSGGYLEDETSIRKEKRFLGSVTRPVCRLLFTQTVYQAGRVEGMLRLCVPTVNLGYDQIHAGGAGIDPVEGASIMQDEEISPGKKEEVGVSLTSGPGDPASPAALVHKADRATYIRVLATLDPIPIVLPKESVPGSNQESSGLVAAGLRWMKRVKDATELPQGVLSVQLFVPDMFGNDVLLTRYLCPQEPPGGINTVCKCAHYVSLLPFLEDWQMFEGVDDMWCTSQQFLDILAGDHEEHAILLHNYILHLIMVREGISGSNRRPPGRTGLRTEVYMVSGRAVPEGDTVYVMVQELSRFGETRTTSIWKPSTAEGFDARDSRCPLIDIACVASQDNVWACMRRNVRPCDLNLDLPDSKTWTPFFSSPANPAPAQGYTSIQEDIAYRPTQQSFVYEVEDLVREALKRDIRRWRSKRSHTAFNADVSNRLAELLPLLEKQALTGGAKMGKDEHRRRLENTMRNRDIVGFPLHSGFVDVDSVVQTVRATGIHEARHPDVQFALAVQAFPYPHNVLSVWVYIASITPS
ncbi:unnamed protein product [Ectocarpus sp. 12 AP-2014]